MSDIIDSLKNNSILQVILIVVVITGGNLWLNRTFLPLGMHRYSQFGVTITHPSSGHVILGTARGRNHSYTEGTYLVVFDSDGQDEMGYYWFSNEMVPVSADERFLEASLNWKLEAWESGGVPVSRVGDVKSSKKDGNDMVYTYIEITVEDVDVPGIMGVWQSGDRVFFCYSLYIDDLENPKKDINNVTELWNQCLRRIKID